MYPSVSIDGRILPLKDATISVTDEGLLRGDGVFEVMRLYAGAPFGRAEHLARMARSAANLRLDVDLDALARDIDGLLAVLRPGDALLRVLATRGGRRIVLVEPLPDLPESIALTAITFAPVRLLDGVKSLSYAANMLAGRLARERGFDEALLVTPHGRVLECPTAAFFWVSAGEIRTPPLADHVLDSITRRIVMGACGAVERPTAHEDLSHAEEAFVASSVREVIGVHRIDERDLDIGPVTRACAAAVRERITAELRAP